MPITQKDKKKIKNGITKGVWNWENNYKMDNNFILRNISKQKLSSPIAPLKEEKK